MKVAIIGCGRVGQKRASSLAGSRLVACADVVAAQAEALAQTVPGAVPTTNWRVVIERKDVDVVIVSATNDLLVEITLAAIVSGKHVLVEKPAARCVAELDRLIEMAERLNVLVRVGFNHRYHPGLCKAKELCLSGAVGELMYIRGRYGHGGRVGYEKEWRANPEQSGGGELIDQGVHLIDLARWFLGNIVTAEGFASTFYWDMPVEDNGFMLLKTARRQIAFLHASCTEWKNLFSFEIFGRSGKLQIEGLGGSYGIERLIYYRMLPQMGPPQITSWEYPMGDTSWQNEFAEFLEDIRLQRRPAADLYDARAALQVVEDIYKISGL
jgi:predicted dehydrogenase